MTTGLMRDQRAGITLVELLVVLVILSLVSGMSLLALPSLRPTPEGERLERLHRARAEAISRGQDVVITVDSAPVRFLPDGRVLGGPLDPLTGGQPHAR